MSVDEVLGDVLSRVGENVEHLAGLDHLTVLHNGYAVADLLDDRHFVGDDNDRDAEGFVQVLEQLQNRLGGLRIECRGSLVAEQHIRVVGQCSCDGNTLLLTAGQLLGVRLRLITDADQIKQALYLFRNLLLERPLLRSGYATLPATVREGIRLKCWKIMPIFLRACRSSFAESDSIS